MPKQRRKKSPVIRYPVLTDRQGKVLRFVVSRTVESFYKAPVEPIDITTKIEWSDLPKTILQAKKTLEDLQALKLIERADKKNKRKAKGFLATATGIALMKQANIDGWWRE